MPKKGTPEYEAWILTPEYRELCRKRSERMLGVTGENHPAFGINRPDVSERNKTVENRQKVSIALSGEKNHNFGICISEERRKKLSIAKTGKPSKLKGRKCPKIADRMRGIKRPYLSERNRNTHMTGDKNPAYIDGRSFGRYCLKFNPRFKRNVRAFQHYRCALCGHIWQPGEVALTVHHIHANKDSCCDESAPRDFVCLCSRKGSNGRSCHHVTIGKEELFAPRFVRYLLKNFGGKSYFTKEEYVEYLSHHIQSGQNSSGDRCAAVAN